MTVYVVCSRHYYEGEDIISVRATRVAAENEVAKLEDEVVKRREKAGLKKRRGQHGKNLGDAYFTIYEFEVEE